MYTKTGLYNQFVTNCHGYYLIKEEQLLRERWLQFIQPSTFQSFIELGCGDEFSIRNKSLKVLEHFSSVKSVIMIEGNIDFCYAAERLVSGKHPNVLFKFYNSDFSKLHYLNQYRDKIIFLWGGTIGNLTDEDVITMLRGLSHSMQRGDRFVFSVDGTQSAAKLGAAYDNQYTEELTHTILGYFAQKYSRKPYIASQHKFISKYDETKNRIVNGIECGCSLQFSSPVMDVNLQANQFYPLVFSYKRTSEHIKQLAMSAGLEIDNIISHPKSSMYIVELVSKED